MDSAHSPYPTGSRRLARANAGRVRDRASNGRRPTLEARRASRDQLRRWAELRSAEARVITRDFVDVGEASSSRR